MYDMWSEVLDTGSGQRCKFRVTTGLEPPKHPGAIQSASDVLPDMWVDIHYPHAMQPIVRCHIQSEPDRAGYIKVQPLKSDGSSGPVTEVHLSDIGVIPYAIPGHIRRWNLDTYTTPAPNPAC